MRSFGQSIAMAQKSRLSDTLRPMSVTTGVLAPKERFDFLNDVYARERLVLAPRRSTGGSISAGSSLWQVGSVRYALTHSSGHIGRRVKGKGPVFLAIRQHHTTGCHSWAEDGYFVTRPGDILVTTNSADGFHSCVDLKSTNIALPIEMVEIDPRAFVSTQIIRVGTLANTLLSIAMENWTKRLQHLPRDSAGLLQGEIISLISHVFNYSTDEVRKDPSYARMRGQAIRRFIDENLFEGNLDVDEISRSFGVSRSSIYREFANDGGVRRYVMLSRLRKALFLLSNSPSKRGAVGKVAHHLGYSDTFAFSKAFRNHFGFSPSEALAIPGGVSSDDTTGGGTASMDSIH